MRVIQEPKLANGYFYHKFGSDEDVFGGTDDTYAYGFLFIFVYLITKTIIIIDMILTSR